jgi:Family of unknown function (DUF6666)
MIDARQFAARCLPTFAAFLLAASCAAFATAQSAAISSDQWRAAGSSQYSGSSAQQASEPDTNGGWRLPNGQSNSGETQSASDAPNPLRQRHNMQGTSPAREPLPFNAPTNAAPINRAQSAASQRAYSPSQQQSMSSARRPQVPQQAYVQPRTMYNTAPANAQRTAGPYVARPTVYNHSDAPSNDGTLWHTINVAFQGQPVQQQPAPKHSVQKQKEYTPESLPAPGDGNDPFQDPVMQPPTGPDAWNRPVGGPYYQPYGQPCCDGPSCPTGGCGEGVCEPGCGAPCGEPCGEPGCGCPSNNCNKDVFCIGPGDDESCHIVQIRWPKWQEVSVFSGVQGFKEPYDQERSSGNFGFNEGINIGAKVPYALLGYQFGYRATEDQLNGDTNDNTNGYLQEFVTAGLFHRSCEGLQFGVVWDALLDERASSKNFHQIRSEVSIRSCGCHEFGFGATVGLNRHGFDDGDGGQLIFQASDQYVLFYRLHGPGCGEGRVYAGFNNDSDGIVGSDMLLPINDCFSVQGNFSYLIPNAKNGIDGATQEAWNVGLGLVWQWDHQARRCFSNCYRPMFNVADNSYLIVDQQGTR